MQFEAIFYSYMHDTRFKKKIIIIYLFYHFFSPIITFSLQYIIQMITNITLKCHKLLRFTWES
jgi:hypothetical protein